MDIILAFLVVILTWSDYGCKVYKACWLPRAPGVLLFYSILWKLYIYSISWTLGVEIIELLRFNQTPLRSVLVQVLSRILHAMIIIPILCSLAHDYVKANILNRQSACLFFEAGVKGISVSSIGSLR